MQCMQCLPGPSQGSHQWRVTTKATFVIFEQKVPQITITTPKKGPNPTTMDKQITKQFFRIKLTQEVPKIYIYITA